MLQADMPATLTSEKCLPVHVADENVPAVHVTVVADGV
jgi:hypothetical protein